MPSRYALPDFDAITAQATSPFYTTGDVLRPFFAPGGIKFGDVRSFLPTLAVRNELIEGALNLLRASQAPVSPEVLAAQTAGISDPEQLARARMLITARDLLAKKPSRVAALNALYQAAVQGPRLLRTYEEFATAIRRARSRKSRLGFFGGLLSALTPEQYKNIAKLNQAFFEAR